MFTIGLLLLLKISSSYFIFVRDIISPSQKENIGTFRVSFKKKMINNYHCHHHHFIIISIIDDHHYNQDTIS